MSKNDSMINSARCEAVADWARAHPSRHNQQRFLDAGHLLPTRVPLSLFAEDGCNTTACLAGATAILYAEEGTVYAQDSGHLLFPDGTAVGISSWALETLRLPPSFEYSVFHCFDNDTAIRRLRWLAKHPECTDARELVTAVPAGR